MAFDRRPICRLSYGRTLSHLNTGDNDFSTVPGRWVLDWTLKYLQGSFALINRNKALDDVRRWLNAPDATTWRARPRSRKRHDPTSLVVPSKRGNVVAHDLTIERGVRQSVAGDGNGSQNNELTTLALCPKRNAVPLLTNRVFTFKTTELMP